MKLNEILTPKKAAKVVKKDETPMFAKRQAGSEPTTKDRLEMARRKFKGETPIMFKRQAESVEG